MEFSFWDIYCPVLAALVSATIFFEIIHFGLAYFHAKRQAKKTQEWEDKLKAQGIDPSQMGIMDLFGGQYGGAPFPMGGVDIPPVPSSGTDGGYANHEGHGQYI